LLRPKALRDAFKGFQAGTLPESEFRTIQDNAIRTCGEAPGGRGFRLVTDGEYRRASYWARFAERTHGLTVKPALYRFHDDHGQQLEFTAPYVEDRVHRTRPIAVDEVRFLAGYHQIVVKVTLPAPSTMHFWRGNQYAREGVYADARAFFHDLGKVYQDEIYECAQAGAQYVQLDEVALVMLCDQVTRQRLRAEGHDPQELVDLYVDAINEAVANRPRTLLVGVHVCRGNFKGKYLAEGGYDSIAERLLQGARVDHFLLEYDTPRAGDFAPLRYLPADKGAVLGLITTKSGSLESLDDLKRKVDEASKHVNMERLGIGPQCGFASTVAGNPLTADDMRAKLHLVDRGVTLDLA
jgi:5-methyltetrahydropteroyltriglutamate--homocysteine methyltransferase